MSNSKPMVSVIVPNYNHSKFLEKRIDSILNQTYQDFELILLDDKSTDNSVDILRRYAQNPKVTAIEINEENSGSTFKQWEKGINMAQGKYIWLAESDDYADCDFLSKCVEQLQLNSNATLCYTGSDAIDDNNNKLNIDFDKWTTEDQKHRVSTYNGNQFVKRNMYWHNYIYNASGVIFRRSVALGIQNNKWVNMCTCGDWYFWTEMAIQGDVVIIREKLNKFRQHSNSVIAQACVADSKFKIAWEESMEITFDIERRFNIDSYRRAISHGTYLIRYKRKTLSAKTKSELISYLSNNTKNLWAEYILYRIYRFMKKFFKSLDIIETDRL